MENESSVFSGGEIKDAGHDRSDWKLNPVIFKEFQRRLEVSYGTCVLYDVFADRHNAQLPIFGVDSFVEKVNKAISSNSFVYINGDWTQYGDVVNTLANLKCLAMVVAPFWTQHSWFGKLASFASHCWTLQSDQDAFLPASKKHIDGIGPAPWTIGLFLCDFRGMQLKSEFIVSHFPTVQQCKSNQRFFVRSKMEIAKIDFRHLIPLSPFNFSFLGAASEGVVHPQIRDIVLRSMEEGFRSGYRGEGNLQRDFSRDLPLSEEKLAMEKMIAEVKKGFCLGPFDECPFPSAWCNKQAIICLLFFRPKHKFINDGKFRLIAHRSFPEGLSFNDLVDRQDCTSFIPGYQYFTLAHFISLITSIGKGTLISLFDVKDAYKQCIMHPEDLWQQVYRVGSKFFVDLGGMFGSKNAGDAWNLVMELIISSLAAKANLPYLRYYVDNGVNLTPPENGKPNLSKASSDFDAILKFMTAGKVPIHDIVAPTTRAKFLGWIFDTDKMTITITPERLSWVQNDIEKTDVKSCKALESVIGIVEFLSTVLWFLKTPLGWLRKRSIGIKNGQESADEQFLARFQGYCTHVKRLTKSWGGSVPITGPEDRAATCLIATDASGTKGRGAIDVTRKHFACQQWDDAEIKTAFRGKATSSTSLELLNVATAIRTFAHPGDKVIIYCDSEPAVSTITRRYSKASEFDQEVMIALDKWCMDQGVWFRVRHVKREDCWIKLCDSLSRGVVCE